MKKIKNKYLIAALLIVIIFLVIGISMAKYATNEERDGNVKTSDKTFCERNNITDLRECIIKNETQTTDYDAAKNLIQELPVSSFSSVEPLLKYYSKEPQIVDYTSNSSVYFTFKAGTYVFGKNYKIDGSNFKLVNTNTVTIDDVSNIENYYSKIMSTENNPIYTTLKSSNGANIIVKILQMDGEKVKKVEKYSLMQDSVNYKESNLYKTTDADGITYYFRGQAKNYIKYAGFYWRIMRINGDGSIRLIYQGPTAEYTNGIGSSKFNNKKYFDLTNNLYKYGDTKTYIEDVVSTKKSFFSSMWFYFYDKINCDDTTKLCTLSTTIKDEDGNNTPVIGKWDDVKETVINGDPDNGVPPHLYTCYVKQGGHGPSDGNYGVYNSDKSTTCALAYKVDENTGATATYSNVYAYNIGYIAASEDALVTDENKSTLMQTIDTWYENNILNKKDSNGKNYQDYLSDSKFCVDRQGIPVNITNNSNIIFFSGSQQRYQQKVQPSYICNQPNDIFTVSNGKLQYPIASLTLDDELFAGMSKSYNNKNYLFPYDSFWTITPQANNTNNRMTLIHAANSIGGVSFSYYEYSKLVKVRPVLNLNSNVKVVSGNGTKDSPYEVTLDNN